MDVSKLSQILAIIRPQAQWALRGNTLDKLEWLDTNQSKPTQEEIAIGESQVDALAYKEFRRTEYPMIGDQLDAIWKCLQRLKSDGVILGSDADAMLNAVNAVKSKYQKPA